MTHRRSLGRALLGPVCALLGVLISAPAAPSAVQTVRLAMPIAVPDEGQIWAYVPDGAGYFAAEGMAVEFLPNKGGGEALKLVATGHADFSIGSPENTLNAVAAGMDLRAVATVVTTQIFRLVVPPESPIKGYTDLKGRHAKVGVASFTSGSFPFAKFALAERGIDPERDVEFVIVGSGGPALDALTAGKIDVLSTWDTQIAIFDSLGTRVRPLPDSSNVRFPGDQILVRADLLRDHPDLVVRFARAVMEGIVFAHANPEAAIKFYDRTFPEAAKGRSEAVHVKILRARLENMRLVPSQGGKWGFIPLSSYERLQNASLRLGTIKVRQNLAGIMTNALIDRIDGFDVGKIRQQAAATR